MGRPSNPQSSLFLEDYEDFFNPHSGKFLSVWQSSRGWPTPGRPEQKKKSSIAELFVQEQHAADTSIGSPASVTTSSYPDFTSYHQQVPDHCLPSKKNHIEQNYFITNQSKQEQNSGVECNLCILSSIIFWFWFDQNARTFDWRRRGSNSSCSMQAGSSSM